jgi:hypothetical protein
MPELDEENGEKLQEYFLEISKIENDEEKIRNILIKASEYISLNMTPIEISSFFAIENKSFQIFFSQLDIWTKSLEETNGSTRFIEPYEIINKIFDCFPSIKSFIQDFGSNIIFIFDQQSDEKVKHICIKYITKLVNIDYLGEIYFKILTYVLNYFKFLNLAEKKKMDSNNTIPDDLMISLSPILIEAVKQIPLNTACYSNLVSELMMSISTKMNQNSNFLFSDSLMSILNKNMTMNSVQEMRYLEMAVDFALISKNQMHDVSEKVFMMSYHFQVILQNSNDVLSQISCLTLIQRLASVPHGYELLEKNNILGLLTKNLDFKSNDFQQNLSARLIIPELINMFTHLAYEQFENINQNFPIFFSFIFQITLNDNNDMDLLAIGLKSFSFLLSKNNVKNLLVNNYETKYVELMKTVVSLWFSTMNDFIKVNAMNCLSQMLATDSSLLNTLDFNVEWSSDICLNNEYYFQAKKCFNRCIIEYPKFDTKKLIENCLTHLKSPFYKIRSASQLFFKSLIQTDWGFLLLFGSNSLNESIINSYILDHSNEIEIGDSKSKFIFKKLLYSHVVQDPTLVQYIGEDLLNSLKSYLQNGPLTYQRQNQGISFENSS